MNLEGKLLGNRYEIIEKIGNGGMATVYKAKCHVLNRYVAVKVLKDEFTTDEEFIKRFAAEAQSAASLAHPNIVSIYDVGNEGSLYYIVMELIKGKTLKEIINEDGVLPWKWSVNIAIQIASALETAHKNNIIHRDIKPHNIIITEDGIAKVTDFGIAKAVSNSTITAFGTTIGSVHYFSPEHARGGFTDAKSDLYSLGVVMYEMLTGKVPFDADIPVSIALKHMQEDPVEPIKLNPEIPTAVNKIIIKAMKKDTNLRYQTATEMLRDLNKALKDPNGNFVFMQDENDFATQKIPIYNNVDETNTSKSKSANNNKKENKLKKFIREHKKLSYLIGAILLFFLTLGGLALISNLMEVKEVQIPNLVNMSREEAEAKARELKIELEFKDDEYSPTVEVGKVISQDPKYIENYKIKEKSIITLVVSKGQETTTMPKVTGLTKEEAIKEIEKANLKPEITEEISKKVEQGYVISQEPVANSKLNAGETVKIVVSLGTGIKETSVPSVIGKKEDEAKNILSSANLKVEVVNEEDSSKETGIVLKQSKDAGTTVEEGTTITITVNKVSDTKTANITVDVKSITGGYVESENITSEEKETVTVNVNVVSGNGKGFTRGKVSKNGTASGTVTGKGRITIEAIITDSNGTVIWSESHPMNLDSETSYTFK